MNKSGKSLIEYGDWYEHKFPFKHYRADNVLDKAAYEVIASNFVAAQNGKLKRANGEVYQLAKGSQHYDALMLGMENELTAIFDPFFSMDFLKSIAQFLKIPFINEVDGGLHSSLKNSRTGWIHSDLCFGWFDGNSMKTGAITFPARDNCEYFTGKKNNELALPQKFVRAATLIFYLCNDGWQKGDGGETALYGANQVSNHTDIDLVPPKNNTLLLFECSPHSYHRFITNPGRIRNSIILWLHSTVDFAESKWGNSLQSIKS